MAGPLRKDFFCGFPYSKQSARRIGRKLTMEELPLLEVFEWEGNGTFFVDGGRIFVHRAFEASKVQKTA